VIAIDTQVVLSTSTIITLGTVFFMIMVLMLMRKALVTIMTAAVVAVLVIIAVQATTGRVLVNLGELGDFAVYYLLKLFDWVQQIFLPMLKDAAADIGQNFT
jgi:uncharacterized membrane protein